MHVTNIIVEAGVCFFMFVYRIRGSHMEMFCKKGFLNNFAKFTGKKLYMSLFLNKICCNIF